MLNFLVPGAQEEGGEEGRACPGRENAGDVRNIRVLAGSAPLGRSVPPHVTILKKLTPIDKEEACFGPVEAGFGSSNGGDASSGLSCWRVEMEGQRKSAMAL